MTIKANDLIALFQQALDEKWGYIWGTRGQTWTQANQNAATRDMTVKYGQKWVGRKVADCSGLFVWAYKKLGASIYHGSNTIWNKYTSLTGQVGGVLSIRPGTAVFMVNDNRRTHIGLYIGGGKCIEAQGTRTGVVMSDISRWDEWGQLTDVDYTGIPADTVEVELPVLRKGSTGAAVKELQTALAAEGYDIGKKKDGTPLIDGIYGSETLSAVRSYQYDHGLPADGIVGPLTWAVLRQTVDDEDGEDKPTEAPDEPQEPAEGNVAHRPLTIEQRIMQLEFAVFGMEFGGESDG